MAVALSAQPVFPISEISPYHQTWTIKARVTSKSQTRTFRRGNSEGKVFSVDLLDAEGGEIRASFFNEAADLYMTVLEAGKVFLFSKGGVKIANRQYNTMNNRYELTFDSRAAAIEACGDDKEIGAIRFNFVDLRKVATKSLPCTLDLCGIVKSYREAATITSKAGAELTKRDITIADDTGSSITLTLWGEFASKKDSEFDGNPVLAVKGVKLSDFNERSASTLNSSHLFFNPPDVPEVERLQNWWKQGGSSADLHSLSSTFVAGKGRATKELSLAEVREESQMVGASPEYYTVVARLRIVQTRKQGEKVPLYYLACPEKKEGSTLACNRKVGEDGMCQVCNKHVTPVARLMSRCQFTDSTDSLWLGTFDEAAQVVLAQTGDQVRSKEQAGEKIEALMLPRYYNAPLKLTLRAKLDSYGGETRASVQCVGARAVSMAEHGKEMLKEVMQMVHAQ